MEECAEYSFKTMLKYSELENGKTYENEEITLDEAKKIGNIITYLQYVTFKNCVFNAQQISAHLFVKFIGCTFENCKGLYIISGTKNGTNKGDICLEYPTYSGYIYKVGEIWFIKIGCQFMQLRSLLILLYKKHWVVSREYILLLNRIIQE